jgi:hypothetical protein
MKQLINFSNTHDFFTHIRECLKTGNSQEAGRLWEEFTCERFIQDKEYVAVYDTNNFANIPMNILKSTNSFNVLSKGAHSFGIDKLCVTRYGDIDVVQDKSSLHLDKNLGTDKAAKMMSLRANPLSNIRNYIVCTTARDLSHYKNVWENQTPLCYGGDYYLPDTTNTTAVNRDIQFWKNIKLKKQNKPTVDILGFISRGPEQDEYIKKGEEYGRSQLIRTGYATWWQIGVGGLGKSVLDPIIISMLNDLFDSAYTNTPAPINVSFYHSSKTLPKNGLEEVQRRRAMDIYDEVMVLSGTDVKEDIKTSFYMTTKASEIVKRCLKAMEQGKSVLILTLYHHAKRLAIVKNLLEKHYKGFKFWSRKRDETDWACSNKYSNYAPAYDERTESVLTYGSSATERQGDAVEDYGTNNVKIHGPCTHVFGWGDAEDKKLIKMLKILLPSVKESDVADLFPEYVNKQGRVDWNMRVDGVAVEEEYPTVGLIADIICLVKTLNGYPEVKRLLAFANTRKQNKLAEVNFTWVAKKILGNNNNAKRVIGLFFQTLNDDFDNSSVKNHNWAIKQAKAYPYYCIQACKVFSRGYDDVVGPYKHHAGIHWDKKNIVDTAQEIFRFTRLDNDKHGKPLCGDPFSYYILPMRYNDLGDEPSWSEERLSVLQGILMRNKNIFTEFESLSQKPLSQRRRSINKNTRFWIPEDFDVEMFSNLVTTVAANSKGIMHTNLFVEAHNWLLTEYMKLPRFSNKLMAPIGLKWLADPKWHTIRAMYKLASSNPKSFREKFWGGDYAKTWGHEVEQQIESNLLTWKLHIEKLKEKKVITDRKVVKDWIKLIKNALHPSQSYFTGLNKILQEKYDIPQHHISQTVAKDHAVKELRRDTEHFRDQKKKVYKLMTDTAEENIGIPEWYDRIRNGWGEIGIVGTEFGGRIPEKFKKNHWGILDAKEHKELLGLYKLVELKGRHDNHNPWSKGLKGDPRVMAVGRKISKTNTGNPNLKWTETRKKKFLAEGRNANGTFKKKIA